MQSLMTCGCKIITHSKSLSEVSSLSGNGTNNIVLFKTSSAAV